MNILVCISHVPDTTTKIKFEDGGQALDKNGVSFVIGPNDEYALSAAVDLKAANSAIKVDVLCVGGAEVEPTIRKALAIGADRGLRVDASARDPYFIAKQIANVAQGGDYQLVMLGKESIATNDTAVPGMVAELLNLPYISYCSKLELGSGSAKLEREIEGGEEVMEAPLPLVLSAMKGISEWKIPNMRGIMQARTKPLEVLPAVEAPQLVSTAKYELPPPKGDITMLPADDMQPLVDVLVDKGVL